MIGATAPLAAGSQAPAVRDYISHSQISTYQACPLRYFFKYVAGLPEITVSASRRFGQAIHAAAEFHYRQLLAGGPAASLDELLAAYQIAWSAEQHSDVVFGKGESVDSLQELAKRVLRAFLSSSVASPSGRIVAIEEELRGELIPSVPDLLCRIDLVVDTDTELVVTDLKTARSAWSAEQVEQSAGQLLLYYELARDLARGKSVRLQFAVLTKTKEPEVELYSIAPVSAKLTRNRTVVGHVWQAIEAGHFYPSPSPMNCPGCPYREPCRDWQG